MADYRDWRDLLDEDAAPAHQRQTPAEPAPRIASVAADDPPPLPDEITNLLAEQERLKAEMAALIGKGPATSEDRRQQQRFPVKAHTKESRIEERRLQQHDERQATLRRRAAQRATAQARAEWARAQARESDALQRRRDAQAERREQELDADAAAKAVAARILRERWQAARQAALDLREAEARQAEHWQAKLDAQRQAQHDEANTAAALAQATERRAAEEADQRRAEALRLAAQSAFQARRKETKLLEQRLDKRRHKQGR
jgi:hypothetical protein